MDSPCDTCIVSLTKTCLTMQSEPKHMAVGCHLLTGDQGWAAVRRLCLHLGADAKAAEHEHVTLPECKAVSLPHRKEVIKDNVQALRTSTEV
jgi:hypothetical protein